MKNNNRKIDGRFWLTNNGEYFAGRGRIELLKHIKEYHSTHNAFAKAMNIKILDIDKGYAKTIMELKSQHKNSMGITHGGAIFAIVDTTLGAAATAYGTFAVTAAANISYIKAGTKGPLTAEARELSKTRKLGTYEVKVYDGDQSLIAIAQATMYRKDKPYPPVEEEK